MEAVCPWFNLFCKYFPGLSNRVCFLHGFKNRTGLVGLAGSIGNWLSIRSGYSKKPEVALKSVNSENRSVQPENRKPERSDRFCKNCWKLEIDLQWSFFCSKKLIFFSILLMVRIDFCNKVFFLKIGYAWEREKMTKCLCLVLKLASWSGIYRSSTRKKGTDDGIVEISNRSKDRKSVV